eukprot:1148011-Pelagomonas_calceolata.AAC.8
MPQYKSGAHATSAGQELCKFIGAWRILCLHRLPKRTVPNHIIRLGKDFGKGFACGAWLIALSHVSEQEQEACCCTL